MTTNNPTQPDSNPDTAEAKIRDLFHEHGLTYSQVLGEENTEVSMSLEGFNDVLKQLKGLLVDARIDEAKTIEQASIDHMPLTFHAWFDKHLAALQQTRQEEEL